MTDARLTATVGIDMGGTGTRVLCTVAGEVAAEEFVSTAELGSGPSADRIEGLGKLVADVIPAGSRLAAVGIGASGPVDVISGEIHNPATLPWFSDIGLVAGLQRRLGVPVTIDNDAVAAAHGEYLLGAARGAARVLMVTLGTGVGGALLIEGRPFRLSDGGHPEMGHIPVFDDDAVCYCTLTGCWEPRASRGALQRALEPHAPAGTRPHQILEVGADRYEQDDTVRQVFLRYGRYVGRGIACLQRLYGPDITVLGGSAARHVGLFKRAMLAELGRPSHYSPYPRVVVAELGERAGALGAAATATAGSP